MNRLGNLDVRSEEKATEEARFKKYITEKIQDINRLMRKQLHD